MLLLFESSVVQSQNITAPWTINCWTYVPTTFLFERSMQKKITKLFTMSLINACFYFVLLLNVEISIEHIAKGRGRLLTQLFIWLYSIDMRAYTASIYGYFFKQGNGMLHFIEDEWDTLTMNFINKSYRLH